MSNSGGTTDGGVSVPTSLLPGFRFSPTDEELLSYYLKKKIAGEDSEFSFIPEINVCELEPRDLPEYFFSKPNYMNTNSNRCFRTTGEGFYKSTGHVREVKAELSQAVIGNKRILPFLEGRAPKGKITNYVMHEFSLPKTKHAQLGPNPNQQGE
ncbi:NAC domain-containing protein 83-like [Prunus avium]|uniref:NAC domain-containing protein 83-like n=1 Tax=Prunus avium TaxID=42229 RepID=A0A6P5RIM0_PRUAV|nr:NAC domain-containing protein 83-like [Prunus avium]